MAQAVALVGGKSGARARATRARLLKAAEELWSRRGYDETTIADVAKRARVAIGTVYYHFPDKRALLLELINEHAETITPRRREDFDFINLLDGDLRTNLRESLHRSYEYLQSNPSLYLVVLALAERDAEIRRGYQRIENLEIERLRDFIVLGQRRGVLRESIDAHAAAVLVHRSIDTVITHSLVHERALAGKLTEPAADRVLNELCDMLLAYMQ